MNKYQPVIPSVSTSILNSPRELDLSDVPAGMDNVWELGCEDLAGRVDGSKFLNDGQASLQCGCFVIDFSCRAAEFPSFFQSRLFVEGLIQYLSSHWWPHLSVPVSFW
jgi:hypothetical protein